MHEEHPVKLIVEDDLKRNRVTVIFRLILAIPHFLFLFFWTIGIFFAALANWVITLFAGMPPEGLHKFMCAYIRYVSHLNAYLWLVGNPYPGFVGEEGEYPIDIVLPARTPQTRWKTFIRIFLALPAIVLATALGGSANVQVPRGNRTVGVSGGALGFAVALLGWWASLFRGRMPKGLRDAGAYSIGYSAQVLAYLLLVTERYPNADPT